MTTIRRATGLDLVLMLLVALIWASAFIAIKIAVPQTGPLWLAAWRVLIGALVLAPYVLFKGMAWPKSGEQWRLIIVMSILNVALPFFLISWAEQTISAGVTALLMGTGPFIALIGSHVLTVDDKITRHKLAAVALGFSGMILIVGWDAMSSLGGLHTIAQLAALGGSLCYVMAGLITRRVTLPSAPLSLIALCIGAAILFPAAIVVDGVPEQLYDRATLMALLYLGVFPTGLAYILRFYLIRSVGFSTFALSVNMIPVFGVMLGVILLGETLRLQVLMALALVVSGLFIARLAPARETAKP